MKCPTPLSIKNPAEEQNPKNLNSIRLEVPCGRCGICQKNRRTQWSFRLREHLKDSKNCYFLTLTYDDNFLPWSIETGEQTLVKEHLQKFIKRLREYDYRKTKRRIIKYYAVGEYGSKTKRPHYHVIIFNLSQHAADNIGDFWSYGFVGKGNVTSASIHYVTKYHVNRNVYDDDRIAPEFSLMSQKLGYGYIERNRKYHLETGNLFAMMDGYKVPLPKIFVDKIFTNENYKKLLKERNYEQSQEQLDKEAKRLKKLGYDQPYKQIWKRSLKKSHKIKHKSQEQDTL